MIVLPIEAAKNTVLMKESNYCSHHKINKQSKRHQYNKQPPKSGLF